MARAIAVEEKHSCFSKVWTAAASREEGVRAIPRLPSPLASQPPASASREIRNREARWCIRSGLRAEQRVDLGRKRDISRTLSRSYGSWVVGSKSEGPEGLKGLHSIPLSKEGSPRGSAQKTAAGAVGRIQGGKGAPGEQMRVKAALPPS